MSEYILEMKNIRKSFAGVRALDGVNLKIKPGTVHALVGENGAGKSTLMKCLFGIYHIDSGEIWLDGKPFVPLNIQEVRKSGLAIIQQELSPLMDMTVMENMWINREPTAFGQFVNHKKMYQDTAAVLKKFGLDLSPKQKLRGLPVAKLQLLEIMNAVSCNARVIIMDEPTSALTDREIKYLFKIVNMLRDEGVAIIYISHKFDEIFELSDEVTVLRDGQWVAHHDISDITAQVLIKEMVGRDIKDMFGDNNRVPGETALEVKGLKRNGKFEGVSFTVRRGEILGITGLVGAGRTEVLEALFGLVPADDGEIKKDGKVINIRSVQDAQKNGMALLTEDRRESGIFADLNIYDNVLIANYNRYVKLGLIKTGPAKKEVAVQSKKLRIKAPSLNTLIKNLSGGNQQKVLLTRWLMAEPEILLLDEPTRGIDIGAKAEIYSIISSLAEEGKSIIMVSSEMPEIIGLCDRTVVMYEGKVTGIVGREEMNEERIMALASNYVS